uniref:RRM domain-containing protein n=1 Tax=Macrostomum lignano TaxID=282301 RepID=A0A1I8G2D0_9PLAT
MANQRKDTEATRITMKEFQPPRAGVVTRCDDATEAVPLCPELRLCLKPAACLGIAVDLPQLTDKCRSISNWEVMEQLRSMAKPHQLSHLRVQTSSLSVIRLDCELPNRRALAGAVKQLDGGRIKLAGFSDFLRVRAVQLKPPCPTKYDWEAFFRDAEGLDAMEPGERPDTVRIGQLPCSWFSDDVPGLSAGQSQQIAEPSGASVDLPTESAVRSAFESFGAVRRIDIPLLNSESGSASVASAASTAAAAPGPLGRFEAFVQFVDCAGFERCMTALRGAKLLLLLMPAQLGSSDGSSSAPAALSVLPTLDFDRTGRLSLRSIRRREAARRRAEAAAELERRRRDRERRRLERAAERAAERQRRAEEAALAARIAAEERRIVAAQRKLESIRLLSELFRRLRDERRRKELEKREARLRRSLLKRRRQEMPLAGAAVEDT